MTTPARATHHWSDVAGAYADTFAHYCAGTIPLLLERARLLPGATALEVGAGTGLLSARIVETDARLTATEPDPGMLAAARQVLPAETRLVRAGLPRLPFATGLFDVVVANFVVNHVDDPRAGVSELARVTRPARQVLFTVWPSGTTSQGQLFARVLDASGVTPPPADLLPPHLDFERTRDGVAALATGAGLEAVSVVEVPISWRIRPDHFWRGISAGIGVIGRALQAQPEAVRTRLRASYDDLSRDLLDGDDLVFSATALLAEGVTP
ncbi:class I SAM-dependent methyltransferase [Nocardioides sp. JQ2195]|uniref:class I SAM-dependent methyltransferase n=1 Tax=Nocardioides sp. JQ2195 TaxID=2592334 RepID=UPI00143E56E1|nr:class I SAM-dependent methyltransferase [Nocardioides sp. JQ2195]QIX27026.1 class I SAM-dependent methyltransferase [Nocardioides sp. JQ2195]